MLMCELRIKQILIKDDSSIQKKDK